MFSFHLSNGMLLYHSLNLRLLFNVKKFHPFPSSAWPNPNPLKSQNVRTAPSKITSQWFIPIFGEGAYTLPDVKIDQRSSRPMKVDRSRWEKRSLRREMGENKSNLARRRLRGGCTNLMRKIYSILGLVKMNLEKISVSFISMFIDSSVSVVTFPTVIHS